MCSKLMLEIGTSAKKDSFMQKQLNFGHWMSKGYFCKHTSNRILSTKLHVIFKLPPCDIFVFASDPGPTQIKRRKKNCTSSAQNDSHVNSEAL